MFVRLKYVQKLSPLFEEQIWTKRSVIVPSLQYHATTVSRLGGVLRETLPIWRQK